MSYLDSLISILAPFNCLNCGREGKLVCLYCGLNMKTVPERCYRCHKLSPGFHTCKSCRSQSHLYSVKVVTVYETTTKRLVLKLKFDGAQAAAREMAQQMARLAGGAEYVVPVPTATRRARARGYDQAKLLAKALSRQTGLPYLDCLRRTGQAHQVGASRSQRIQQLQGRFRIKQAHKLQNARIILIDDVVTTGATLEAAAAACRLAGAKRVEALVFAQP